MGEGEAVVVAVCCCYLRSGDCGDHEEEDARMALVSASDVSRRFWMPASRLRSLAAAPHLARQPLFTKITQSKTRALYSRLRSYNRVSLTATYIITFTYTSMLHHSRPAMLVSNLQSLLT